MNENRTNPESIRGDEDLSEHPARETGRNTEKLGDEIRGEIDERIPDETQT